MTTTVPNISVIVPIYGVERYIEQSLRSLFTQSKTQGVEFILVNDCTKDRSMDIVHSLIEEFPQLNIKVVEHSENGGLAVARQSGMDVATGEYVLHVDSDDWCEPTMLEELYAKAVEEDADVVSTDYFISSRVGDKYAKQVISGDNIDCIKSYLNSKLFAYVWNKMMRRSIFVENNIRWIPKIDLLEDLLIVVKFYYYSQKISYLQKAFVHYRQSGGSMVYTISSSRNRNFIDFVDCLEQFIKDRGIYEMVVDDLLYRKLLVKELLLKRNRGKLQREFTLLYPELNSLIMKEKRINFRRRFALYCAVNGCRRLSNIYYYFSRNIRSVYYKVKNY